MMPGSHIDEPQTIGAYIRELDAALSGPSRWKRRVLDETRDGLFCDLESAESEREVVSAWGPVNWVAAEFNVTGRFLLGRRMAWHVLQWLPVIIVSWALVVQLSPTPWPHEPRLITWMVPLLSACVVATVAGSVQLIRRTASRRRHPELTGIGSVCVGIGVGVLCLVVLLGYRLNASHWHIYWPAVCLSITLTIGLLATVIGKLRHLMRPVGA